MTRRVALQMDAPARLNPATDSTLRLGLEAQKRGYDLWCYTPDKLYYRNGEIFADAQRLTLREGVDNFYTLQETTTENIKEFDVVWLRQDPPFNMAYITTTHLLERVHPKPFVVNNPASVRNLPEKWFPTELARFMPPTLISADAAAIMDFHREHKHIVIKPLYGHAGYGISHLSEQGADTKERLEALFSQDPTPVVAQKFLPEMKDGERRIILIDGTFAAIAGRIPAAGQVAASTRLGAHYVKAEISKRQLEICEALGPLLKTRGLIYTGLDVIDDWLTEINITSPTSIPPINKLYGLKLEADIWDAVENYLP